MTPDNDWIDDARMIDEGCPNWYEVEVAEIRANLPREQARLVRLARRHKNIIHVCLLTAIIVSLFVEGGKRADWLFLALSIVVEIS